ncbi:aminotransferase class V-fold PLP-dependent enzyme [Mycoplasma sp. Mirounga ES2805-ORL]|uniref:aminotransferase class V-fold PLP-dependent enzyme n=1 Tax=Mycoplasma sp. Mirounga ES2805-ORL TaxID=754514 RepID=UPI00197C9D9A|nr:aminotransferase class V-fold PLP-dependent enzyme [Mycoplasma sp. Mirounga ES2805-ORL]QSF13707.1 aminotransferase class V-fold PLP-dependent enzyme [Mycoplasma sp. Mirounga ES2805-ORL]
MKNNSENIRALFPILNKITYFDSSAMALKPTTAVDAVNKFYREMSVSTRTSDTEIGMLNKKIINSTREKVGRLINADPEEIIFTSGCTDSLNKAALMLKSILNERDEILVSGFNHSSNIVPWIKIAEEKKAKVKIVEDLVSNISKQTKIICLSQTSNSFEHKEDINNLYKVTREKNIILVNDVAQAIVSSKVDLHNTSDIIAFSSNKLYGPTGFGVLAIRDDLLKKLNPPFYGGGAVISIIDSMSFACKANVEQYEPGTPNLSAIHMFNESLNFFENILGGQKGSFEILRDLSEYAFDKLSKIENLVMYNSRGNHILLFNIGDVNSHDVASYLGSKDIYVRAGLFCTHYVSKMKNIPSFVRVSLGVYNTKEDIDKLYNALKEGGNFIVL